MDARGVLLAQVSAAEADLDAAERMLRADAFTNFPERDEVLSRLQIPFAEQRGVLTEARKATNTRRAWTHLNSARLASAAPLREALALVAGMLMRQSNLDDGVAIMADALQREVGRRMLKVAWPMASVPDVEERYHRVSELIRIRFPDATVWGLPAVAHEIGHAVVAGFVEVDKKSPGNSMAFQTKYKAGPEREVACDVIATLALGPAFVSACLLLRFMPATANQVFDSHPAERDRAAIMLSVLREMSFGDTADWLESAWSLSLEGARVRKLSAAATAKLDRRARDVCTFSRSLLPDLPLESMAAAVGLAEEVQAGRKPEMTPATTLIDALNAVWLVRRRKWGTDGRLTPSIDSACHQLCLVAASARGVSA